MTSEALYVLKLLLFLVAFAGVCVTAGAVWAVDRVIRQAERDDLDARDKWMNEYEARQNKEIANAS